MIQFLKKFPFILGLLLFGGGCASYTDEIRSIRSSYIGGDYEDALSELETSDLKGQDRNRLLFLLEKSMILDRKNELKSSRKLLLRADEVVDELYRSSLSGDVASFLYNDSAADYQGEDFEKVAIHLILALSFLDDNQINEATVEARRINTRLNEINSFYEDHKNRYAEDAFARYLAAMIYESREEWDSAIVDYRAALKTYKDSYTDHFETSPPDHLIASLYRLAKMRGRNQLAKEVEKEFPDLSKKADLDESKGELVVIHELDAIAIKVAQDFVLPISGQIVRFSFPVIRSRARGIYGKTGVEIEGKGFSYGEMSQNMDKIASITLDDRRLRLVLKQGARLLLKGQMVQQAERNFGPLGGLAANIYGAVTETADTRSWTLLPAAFFVSRIRLKPGSYDIKVTTNGRLSKLRKVDIKKGKITFLRDAA